MPPLPPAPEAAPHPQGGPGCSNMRHPPLPSPLTCTNVTLEELPLRSLLGNHTHACTRTHLTRSCPVYRHPHSYRLACGSAERHAIGSPEHPWGNPERFRDQAARGFQLGGRGHGCAGSHSPGPVCTCPLGPLTRSPAPSPRSLTWPWAATTTTCPCTPWRSASDSGARGPGRMHRGAAARTGPAWLRGPGLRCLPVCPRCGAVAHDVPPAA